MLIPHRNWKRFFEVGTRCITLLLFCQVLFGQANEKPRAPRDNARGNLTADLSDLAKDNLNRVAASAVQIREVLVKDAGLLVELKRWIAKEATDSGQVIEDSKLLDDAVFDRLNRDVAFRAVATRLLQRYGYLMPSPNPDSSFGKEEDILLKERARRLVQIEAQEDAESLQPNKKNNQDVERTATCDPRQDENCDRQGMTRPRSNRSTPNETPVPDEDPSASPDDGSPSFPPNPSRTLRTGMTTEGQGPAQQERMSSPEIELASSSPKSGSDLPSSQSSSQFSVPSISNGLIVARDGASDNAPDADRSSTRDSVTSQSTRQRRPSAHQYEEEDVTPVKMVHRANPYADILSSSVRYVRPGRGLATPRGALRYGRIPKHYEPV